MAKVICGVGSVVEFINEITTTPWPGEEPVIVHKGSQYETVSLTESGWDLIRRTGQGPIELRILNSEMTKYVKLVKKNKE